MVIQLQEIELQFLQPHTQLQLVEVVPQEPLVLQLRELQVVFQLFQQ